MLRRSEIKLKIIIFVLLIFFLFVERVAQLNNGEPVRIDFFLSNGIADMGRLS
jgi:hypothetical protein